MLSFSATSVLFNFCVALGIGLLVGAERERRKGEGPFRRSAGIRTFTVCTLAGFVAQTERIDFRLVSRAIRELEGNISR
mgnify:CR=1 FL=1